MSVTLHWKSWEPTTMHWIGIEYPSPHRCPNEGHTGLIPLFRYSDGWNLKLSVVSGLIELARWILKNICFNKTFKRASCFWWLCLILFQEMNKKNARNCERDQYRECQKCHPRSKNLNVWSTYKADILHLHFLVALIVIREIYNHF